MNRFRLFSLSVLSCCILVLAGCEDDATKAERYYQSGLALMEEGDTERALVELRNVFKHDGFHKEARQLYADTVLELGRTQEAYSQYLRLIEQYPDTLDARVTLAELAIARNNWEEAERHGKAAIALDTERPDVRAIDLVLKYREASLGREQEARAEAAAGAAELLKELRLADAPDNDALVRIVIDFAVQSNKPQEALTAVNAALERAPEAEDLNLIKARLLAETGDTQGTGAQLKKMVDLFPENNQVKQALINWYLVQEDMAGAEAFLRQQAGDDTGPTPGHVSVIQLLQNSQGTDAARAEIKRLIAANDGTENGRFYSAMLASMDFQTGNRDTAIADVRAAIAASEEGEQKNRLNVMLAQMLGTTGAQEEADALVDVVLEADASNVAALRLRAARLIREDKPGEAIIVLRRALDQNPRDAETLTLMAQAHERDGDTDLVGERLALAMEVSGNAAPEALRYARFLMSQDRPQVALNVLEDARRRAPGSIPLLVMLANTQLSQRDYQAAQEIIASLRMLDTDVAEQAATELEVRVLQAQDRTEDSLKVLEESLGDQSNATDAEKTRAIVLVVQAQIRAGKVEAARTTLNEALETNPDNPDLQLLDASMHAVMGEMEEAERIYRDLIARFPTSELPVRLLLGVLNGTGQSEAADQLLDEAIAAMPEQPNLLWMKASRLEQRGDIDGAIAVYEGIYARDSSNPVVANNLASLITTHRDDADSLTRAANIVRRLRGTQVPAFQDTYGWISYRRGNLEEALEYLEPAAAALVDDPLVHYHLGTVYAAAGRKADARATLERALEIAGDSPLPQFDKARELLRDLADGSD